MQAFPFYFCVVSFFLKVFFRVFPIYSASLPLIPYFLSFSKSDVLFSFLAREYFQLGHNIIQTLNT